MLCSIILRGGLSGLIAAAGTFASAADVPNLPELPELRLQFGSPTTIIAAPQTGRYPEIARKLADALERHARHRPSIVPDTTVPADLGAGPVIALGNLMDSRLVRSLYLQVYDFTDFAWPSAGGHVLRTIRDPLGTGAHVLLLGGSDTKGVADATDAWISILKTEGSQLGYLNNVKLGRLAADIESYTAKYLTGDEKIWLRSGQSGSWEYMAQIAQAGLGYLRTGNEAYLSTFESEIRRWFDRDVYHPSSEAPQMLHGFVYHLVLVWDLVRDHPHFTPERRREFDKGFLYIFRSPEGPGRIKNAAGQSIVRDNHGTRTALDAFFGGRYFLRRFNLPEANQWLDMADRYFAPQMASAKPVCDDWTQQWASSLHNTLIYAMAADKTDYFRSQPLRLAADRALIAYPNAQGPLGYLSACSYITEDTGYLSGFSDINELVHRCAALLGQGIARGDDYLRAFCTGRPITPRKDLLNVTAAPVDPLWYNTIDDTGFNPGNIFAPTAPVKDCFDKVAIRDGWGKDDFYLLFDGISGGHHAYQDANCILRINEAGLPWLGTARRFYGVSGVRAQNGISFSLNGVGPGRIHRYARLLYSGKDGDYSAIGGALEGLGDVRWQRHILRKYGRWTLVVDQIAADKAGELLAERFWHVRGQVTPCPDGLVSKQTTDGKPRYLHLSSAGIRPENMICSTSPDGLNRDSAAEQQPDQGSTLREIIRADVLENQPVEFGALLVVYTSPGKSDLRLTRTDAGWQIDSPEESTRIQVTYGNHPAITATDAHTTSRIGRLSSSSQPTTAQAPATGPAVTTLPIQPDAPTVSLPWQPLRVGNERITAVAIGKTGQTAAGDEKGLVASFTAEGKKQLNVKCHSTILSLHFVDNDIIVGEDRGVLTRFAPDGTQRWQVVIPYVPMAWPYWSEYASRIREISSADMNADGKPEILISNSDRRIYAYDEAGHELWRTSVEWGIFTAMTTGRFGSSFGLYGGASHPSIHGYCLAFNAAGKLQKHYSRSDIQSWSCPSRFCDMRLADVNDDGQLELVTGIDTNCRQLIVYRHDGVILWDADVAGAAQALTILPSADSKQSLTVVCASSAGYVTAFDGKTGTRRWFRFVGEPATFIAPCKSGVLTISPSGTVSLIDRDGKLVGRQAMDSPATAFLQPGDHRTSGATLLGTRDGRLHVLQEAMH